KKIADASKIIKEFPENPEIKILNGRFGAYIAYQKKNIKIPKDLDPKSLTLEKCLELIEASTEKETKKTASSEKTEKKENTGKKGSKKSATSSKKRTS
ncbi:MAG: DNA topoisomerase I, partial [Flammeovirgaceae bacterium]|nr:DNA topoisomerase I [Flammeovirgaceae bacterium]